MGVVARLDEYGKPAWMMAMIAGFILFWPVGLAILFYLIGSGRMSCWKHERRMGRWYNSERSGERGDMRDAKEMFRRWAGRAPSSGNRAFDEYREETITRLEQEQKEFQDFLERLRHAKDKQEFDDFMADRRRGPVPDAPKDVTPTA